MASAEARAPASDKLTDRHRFWANPVARQRLIPPLMRIDFPSRSCFQKDSIEAAYVRREWRRTTSTFAVTIVKRFIVRNRRR